MNFTQKISEVGKLSVIIISKADQFHSKYGQNASVHVCRLNEKLDIFYQFQKCKKKDEKADQFLGSHFQFHGHETKKKVTNSDCQNHTTIGSFLKISLRFQSYPTTEHFNFF